MKTLLAIDCLSLAVHSKLARLGYAPTVLESKRQPV